VRQDPTSAASGGVLFKKFYSTLKTGGPMKGKAEGVLMGPTNCIWTYCGRYLNFSVPEIGNQVVGFRKSLTRTALPCERGTAPELLMSTAQVTPIIDLRC